VGNVAPYLPATIRPGVRYRVAIANVPDGLYPEALLFEGRDVLSAGLLFERPGPVELDVLMGSPAAAVRGLVTDGEGRPVPGAVVALLPEDRTELDKYVAATADPDGRFDIRTVPPGDYRLYAWAELPGEAWRNAAFMEPYNDLGIPLVAVGGERVTLEAEILGASSVEER
jgi:hypothetical protein